ncbi:Neurogenic locus protein delta [Amphibalanus amphitrite]|uniref:Delta-like protein n=1 Tax=Amphibalanus amphitrite TaxID=1232801 RepID=A0A6A4WUT0_AMPAM|nr:Neurogenic locus protein delta [Amphibalanus amphitrite]
MACRRAAPAHRLLALLVATVFVASASAGGVFELKLRSFENKFGLDAMDGCCSGGKTSRGICVNQCATKFRVCLMHYQRVIDEHPSCTFGEFTTPVLGGNTFKVQAGGNGSFVNPIAFPFSFSWPGTFSLVIEAWHEKADSDEAASFEARHTLVHRVTKQGWLNAGSAWTRGEGHTARHSVEFEFRVQCDPFYYGDSCNIMCKGSQSSVFGHYECLENGTRKCLPGWTGDYCTNANCMPGCHSEHGFCDQPNQCQCRSGWKGKFCDVCERYPGCRNGTCSTAWGCDCLEGWGGLFCEQDLNYCTNHRPCKNGGTCYNTGQGSYTCECAAGFNGTDCEIEEGGCARHPCLNGGTCGDTGDNYTCNCPRGWTGHRCETAAETCSDRPCQNGGTCQMELDRYQCRCPRGFKGTNCEQRDTFCTPDTCQNGGNCVNEPDGYRCVCPVGFSGTNCEDNVDDCAVNPCRNGGTCYDEVNAFRCICIPGFMGSVCQINIDDCLTNPCANGGTCHDHVNSFMCTCRPGFTGPDCSVNVDECAGQMCQNGGTCVDRVGDFECRCREGYVGELCQFEGVVPEWAQRRLGLEGSLGQAPVEADMPDEHVVLISTLSVSVPALVLVSIAAILCMKYRRRRAAEKADDEARRQNAENASAGKRQFEENMIVNALDYPSSKVKNIEDPPYSLEPAKSQKQLNIDPARRAPAVNSASASSAYDKVDFETACRTSPALKVCVDGGGPSTFSDASCARAAPNRTGVYVIDEHGADSSLAEGMYATEV